MKRFFTRLMAAVLAMVLMVGSIPAEANAAASMDGKLPDPGKFLRCNRGEDQDARGTSWLYSYKFEMNDNGVQAACEFLELLKSPEYKLKLTDYEKLDYTDVSAHVFYNYGYTYTGSKKVGRHESYEGENLGNVHVSVFLNYQEGWILLSFYFGDGFKVVDCRKHTSYRVTDYNTGNGGSGGTGSGSGKGRNTGNSVPCGTCNKSGKCQKCGGDGYVYSSASRKEDRNCPSCHTHRGKCGSCGGDGWLN